MTIEKGKPWGIEVTRPSDLQLADSDQVVAHLLTADVGAPVAPTSGDLHRTIGARPLDDRLLLVEFPIDLLRVRLDDERETTAVAHVTVQSPSWSGGWWRGPVLMVMNAQFLGDWHVVSRGHPNDGRAESVEWGSEFGLRQRWEARRRLPTGGHVPHPAIETRSFRERSWTFDRSLDVCIDGRRSGRARSLQIVVEPDAAVVYG